MRNKISQIILGGPLETLAKMHRKRMWHRSKLLNYENTGTKQQFRINILVAIYRILEYSHTKHPSHKHCEGEICKNARQNCKKTHVLKMRPLSRKLAKAAKVRPLSKKRCKVVRTRPAVEKTLRKRLNATPVKKTAKSGVECNPCQGNAT